jgi:hypothetical protein
MAQVATGGWQMGYSWVKNASVRHVPGACYCPRAVGRHCDVHDPRPDPEGSRAQRRAAKKAKPHRGGG